MKPIAWYGGRLLCVGNDGRVYLKKRTTWFDRWWYRNLQQEDQMDESPIVMRSQVERWKAIEHEARIVMVLLETDKERCLPYLLGNDDNPGQRLRDALAGKPEG